MAAWPRGILGEFVRCHGHDVSRPGVHGIVAACTSGAGHLLSCTGANSIPSIDFLEQSHGADCERERIGGSVPATEHAVMCAGG